MIIENGGEKLIVNKGFLSKTFSQNARHGLLAQTMEMATKVNLWLPSASLIGVEPGIHHKCAFLVYEADFEGSRIQCKVKDQAEKMVYTMRIIK